MTLKTPQTKAGRLMRSAAFSAVLLGALATLPYSVAAAHPDDTLAGGTVSSSTKSSHSNKRHKIVSVVTGDNNGNPWEKKFEIEVENGNITAFETDEKTGRKRQMALNEIKNFDADVMNGSQWSLRVDERGQLILLNPDTARALQAAGGQGLLMPPPPPVPAFPIHPYQSETMAEIPVPPHAASPVHSISRRFMFSGDKDDMRFPVKIMGSDGELVVIDSHENMEKYVMKIASGAEALKMSEIAQTLAKLDAAKSILADTTTHSAITSKVERDLATARRALENAERELKRAKALETTKN